MTLTHTVPSRPLTRLSALAVAALALTGSLVAPAGAAPGRVAPAPHRVVHSDAAHDVVRFDTETEAIRRAPRERSTDVRRTVVDHQAGRVVLRTQVRELRRSGYRLVVAEILTPGSRRYELVVDYGARPIGPRIGLSRSGSGAEVPCEGATWEVRPAADSVVATVPRSCLGDPRWVRVGLATVSAPRHLRASWADDSRARGMVGDEHLVLGPRQPRA